MLRALPTASLTLLLVVQTSGQDLAQTTAPACEASHLDAGLDARCDLH